MYASGAPACAANTPGLPWNQGWPGCTLLLVWTQPGSVPAWLKFSTMMMPWAAAGQEAASARAAAARREVEVFIDQTFMGARRMDAHSRWQASRPLLSE